MLQAMPAAPPGAEPDAAAPRWSEAARAALVGLLPRLRAYARTLEPSAAAADDLLQDAVVRALAARPPPSEELAPWLFTVLRNRFLNLVRRRRVEARADALMQLAPPALAEPADSLTHTRELLQAMATLPAAQREALVLIGAHGFAYDQVARITGVPVGTVKARVARGRAALAQRLHGAGADH
jgi:RNA polymerase sigma-70 factor (ECF subfamily)